MAVCWVFRITFWEDKSPFGRNIFVMACCLFSHWGIPRIKQNPQNRFIFPKGEKNSSYERLFQVHLTFFEQYHYHACFKDHLVACLRESRIQSLASRERRASQEKTAGLEKVKQKAKTDGLDVLTTDLIKKKGLKHVSKKHKTNRNLLLMEEVPNNHLGCNKKTL